MCLLASCTIRSGPLSTITLLIPVPLPRGEEGGVRDWGCVASACLCSVDRTFACECVDVLINTLGDGGVTEDVEVVDCLGSVLVVDRLGGDSVDVDAVSRLFFDVLEMAGVHAEQVRAPLACQCCVSLGTWKRK